MGTKVLYPSFGVFTERKKLGCMAGAKSGRVSCTEANADFSFSVVEGQWGVWDKCSA